MLQVAASILNVELRIAFGHQRMFDEILFAVAHNDSDKGLLVPLYTIRNYDAANFSLLSFHTQ